jgi:sterol desaturase/sphingolipid hydroxylase (fatty acid hydroxylase superfamily)
MKKHESIRLFESPILEAMTHVHPITPLLMWSPVAGYLIWRAFNVNHLALGEFALWTLAGLIFWTLAEYLIHRYVFHFNAKGRAGQYFVFLFHGIHHDDPDDPTRLVMPPVPGIILMAIIYTLFELVLPDRGLAAFTAAFIVGYLCYDYIHYATHHFPMRSKVGSYLRKYHLRHHHAKEHSKYGVSNPLWDYVFGSVTGPKKEYK